jgi:hypothetical protein
MWRSFFLAVGIGLMVLGVEALVFERVLVNETAKLPKFLDGAFEKDLSNSFASPPNLAGQANSQGQSYPALQNATASDVQRMPYASGSRFGPSRFSGPRSGGYGGPRVDLSRSGINSNTTQTGNAFPVSFPNEVNSAGNNRRIDGLGQPRGPRVIVSKEWMPWSLLAAGAIIFLYTSSHGRSAKEY